MISELRKIIDEIKSIGNRSDIMDWRERAFAECEKMERHTDENRCLKIKIQTLYDAIKHGDNDHQNWLKKKIEEHFFTDEY